LIAVETELKLQFMMIVFNKNKPVIQSSVEHNNKMIIEEISLITITKGVEMKIHFLGTGNASNMSAKGHQSILCQTKDSHFFVDFGPTALLNSFRFNLNINEISHLFLTHFHGDHSGGIPYLLLYHRDILQRQTPFYFYGPAGIEKYLRNLIEANYPGTEFPFELIFEEIAPDKAHISPETVKSKFTTLDARQIALIHSDAATIKKLKQLDLEKMVYPEDGDYLEI
jgi:ribonuclease BN (tRNA processing enzyme)